MQLTTQELKTIVENSVSLWEWKKELLSDSSKSDLYLQVQYQADLANERLQKWMTLTAPDDHALFEKRLSLAGLDYELARFLLSNPQKPTTDVLPAWTNTLNEIYEAVTSCTPSYLETYSFPDDHTPLPFQELFIPVVLLARQKLQKKTRHLYHSFTKEAHKALERALLSRLSDISAQVLLVEFNTFLAFLQITEGQDLASLKEAKSKKHYLSFIHLLYQRGFHSILLEYPVLAKLMATLLNQWVANTALLVERSNIDKPLIQEKFKQAKLPQVTKVDAHLSDPHYGGQSVHILTFESGFKLVYKPKNPGLEAAYYQLLEWLNQQNFPQKLQVIQIIDRQNYGWAAYVPYESMDTLAGPANYFQRAGMLLGLIYLFGGVDFHSENMIACGEQPVLIDLETFFHPEFKLSTDIQKLLSAADLKLYHSVMKSHFLPNMERVNDQFQDYTALGKAQAITKKKLVWKYVNCDAMQYLYEEQPAQFSKKAPRYQQENVYADKFAQEIKQGFSLIYHFFAQFAVTKIPEVVTRLFQNKSRFLFRATSSYLAVFEQALYPDSMKNGIDFSIALDTLSQSLLQANDATHWKLYQNEIEAMWNLDVPYFHANGFSNALHLNKQTQLDDCFDASPFDSFRDKLAKLGNEDLHHQLTLIDTSTKIQSKSVEASSSNGSASLTNATYDQKSLLYYASLIAEKIKSKAIYNALDEPSWIIVKGLNHEKKALIQSTSFGLYDGALGIAIFYAAMGKVTQYAHYKEFSYATMALTSRWLYQVNGEIIRNKVGIGGASGIGSIIYAYVTLSKLLDDPSLINHALLAASFITPKSVQDDDLFDIIDGCSGTILGLITLYKATGDKHILNKARWAGEHLLNNRVDSPEGFKVWATRSGGPMLTGFSHGAAGISYALLQLYELTRETKYLQASKETINYENSKFVQMHQNWLDLRFYDDPAADFPLFAHEWCNGAPGIGLIRTGMLATLNTHIIREDIKTAIQTTCRTPLSHLDHWCCGNIGRAEILFTAALKTSNIRWKKAALGITSQVIQKAHQSSGFEASFRYALFDPTLFKGYAGLGYHLLRLEAPEQLPCILLYE